MSWRTGTDLFLKMWPLIQEKIPDREHRIDFTARLIALFVDGDMDPWEIEDVHKDIRAAMRLANIEIQEPDRYVDDNKPDPPPEAPKPWWKP